MRLVRDIYLKMSRRYQMCRNLFLNGRQEALDNGNDSSCCFYNRYHGQGFISPINFNISVKANLPNIPSHYGCGGKGYKNKFKNFLSSHLGACCLLIHTYGINKSKIYESKCISFLLMFNKLPQVVIGQLQFLWLQDWRPHFFIGCQPGTSVSVPRRYFTPCHVAYSIFRSSSREFSHQIPVTL